MILEALNGVTKADAAEMQLAKKRWDSIAKPLSSLGLLEETIIRMGGIFGSENIPNFKPALVIMCGDHGVTAEGVTQTGSEVTAIVTENFEKCETSAAVMAKCIDVDIFPIDIAIDNEGYANKELIAGKITDRKIAKGTKNLAKESAMTEKQCADAINCGIEIVGQLKKQGYNIIATGEMGIGNTTPASALAAWFLNISAEEATGKGAGLSKDGLERKINAVKRGIARFGNENEKTALDALKSLGGLDIAGMVGLFLGGAVHKLPVIADGFISTVAALAAVEICEKSKDYMFASHVSHEICAKKVLHRLGLKAPINAELCLGEGTGALTFIPMIKMSAEVYLKMSTFKEINVESYKEFT